jgi:hypothetical protein
VLKLAEANNLNHFDYHEDRFDATVQYVTNIIKVCYLERTYSSKLTLDSGTTVRTNTI